MYGSLFSLVLMISLDCSSSYLLWKWGSFYKADLYILLIGHRRCCCRFGYGWSYVISAPLCLLSVCVSHPSSSRRSSFLSSLSFSWNVWLAVYPQLVFSHNNKDLYLEKIPHIAFWLCIVTREGGCVVKGAPSLRRWTATAPFSLFIWAGRQVGCRCVENSVFSVSLLISPGRMSQWVMWRGYLGPGQSPQWLCGVRERVMRDQQIGSTPASLTVGEGPL